MATREVLEKVTRRMVAILKLSVTQDSKGQIMKHGLKFRLEVQKLVLLQTRSSHFAPDIWAAYWEKLLRAFCWFKSLVWMLSADLTVRYTDSGRNIYTGAGVLILVDARGWLVVGGLGCV